MSRTFSTVAPVVSLALAVSLLAGCAHAPATSVVPLQMSSSQSLQSEVAALKETRAQAEARAKRYIAEFNGTHYRSITSRTEMLDKIARTDADAAYDFVLQEVNDLDDLQGEMKNLSDADAQDYEQHLMGLLDDMTPDQTEAQQRAAKAKALNMDLDTLTVVEDHQDSQLAAKWGGSAHVGTRNRILSEIESSKLFKAAKHAVKNTRKFIKKALDSIKKKLHWLF